MFYYWLRWNIDDMGWFFDLELSESTLVGMTHGQEEAYKNPPTIFSGEELEFMYQDKFTQQLNKMWAEQ